MAGVTMVLATIAIFVALIQFDNASGLAGLPNPYMTIDSNEKLLKLNCTPQASKIGSWNKAWELFIFASVQGHGRANVTVAKLTHSEKGPELGEDFRTTAALLGGLLPKDSMKPVPFLSVYVVMGAANYGAYYCEIKLNSKSPASDDVIYSKKVQVGDVVKQGNIDDEFDAKITTVTRVNITWQHPRLSTFTEAIVTRTLVDSEGRETSPTESLAVVLGADVFKTPETALVVFQDHRNVQGHNYTLTAYVLPVGETCGGKPCPVQFSCYVPYKDCYGDSEQFCSCRPVSLEFRLSKGAEFGITVAAVLVLMTALLGLLICCRQKGHCTKLRRALSRCIEPERQTASIETQVDVPEKGNIETQTAADTLTDANTSRTNMAALPELDALRYGASIRGFADVSMHRPTTIIQTEETFSKKPYNFPGSYISQNTGAHRDPGFGQAETVQHKKHVYMSIPAPYPSFYAGDRGGSLQDKPHSDIAATVPATPLRPKQPDDSRFNDVTNQHHLSWTREPLRTAQTENLPEPRDQWVEVESLLGPKTCETGV